jgi:hypothetical protein
VTNPFDHDLQDHGFAFIRERVSLNGKLRPLEDAKDLAFLHLPLEEIGVVKEAPVSRKCAGSGGAARGNPLTL